MVSDFLKNKIKDRGVTLTFIALKTGIDLKILSYSLNNKLNLREEEMLKIAEVLEMNIGDFSQNQNQAS